MLRLNLEAQVRLLLLLNLLLLLLLPMPALWILAHPLRLRLRQWWIRRQVQRSLQWTLQQLRQQNLQPASPEQQ